MRKLTAAAFVALALLATACADNKRDPVSPNGPAALRSVGTLGGCTTLSSLTTLAHVIFDGGSPNVQSVIGKLNNMDKSVQKGDIAGAQASAQVIIDFVTQKAQTGRLPGTTAQVNSFIGGVRCYAGLDPNTFLIQPTDQPQTINNQQGNSGVSLQGNTVTVPTLLTITLLDQNLPPGIQTKLDQYPTFISITTSSTLTKPAVVAICLGQAVPVSVFARLHLGHQKTSGFEITPSADPTFLNCPTSLGSTSRIPEWMRSLANVVLPKKLFAWQEQMLAGGVGGVATEFSPFDAVDPGAFMTGGVGGVATEFQRTRAGGLRGSTAPSSTATPSVAAPKGGTRSASVSGGVCTSVDATVGTALDPLCRPVITIKTHNGTILSSVPVSWGVASGGGVIAPETIADQTCGTFGSTAATSTDVGGKAGVCWTLGPNSGANTVTATPNFGGDAPAGVLFLDQAGNALQNLTFTATGLKITPTVTATGETVPTYDGNAHPGSGTCSNGLTPALSYNTVGGLAPVDAGSYTLTVTCGDDGPVYNKVTAQAAISIGVVTPTVTVNCPVSVVFNNAAQTPCTASVTAVGLSQTPTPSYANNTNVGTATASYSFTAIGNYAAANGSTNFAITAAATTTTVNCPVSVVFNNSAQTPCSASVTGPGLSLTPTPSYTNNTNVGTAGASYTYTATGNYQGGNGSANFAITAAPTTTTVNCPASVVFTGSALTPCSASVTGPGLSLTPTPSYSNNTNVGTAGASYTYTAGGNYQGSNGSNSFTITVAGSSTSLSCPASVPYNGAVQNPCTATATGASLSQGLTVVYAPTPVRDAGPYSANASFAGDANHSGSAATPGGFSITKLGATATAGSGTMSLGGSAPALPCGVTGLLAGDVGTVACTTSVPGTLVPGVNVTTPHVTPASPVDYLVTPVNGTLTVHYVQQSCFASPIFATMPSSSSTTNPRRGSTVAVKCRLVDATGRPVVTAHGNLLVQDKGTNGLGAPVTLFSSTNVFTVSNDGDFDVNDGIYTYNLSTTPLTFVVGHYYLVTATWDDGTTTTGWFYLRS